MLIAIFLATQVALHFTPVSKWVGRVSGKRSLELASLLFQVHKDKQGSDQYCGATLMMMTMTMMIMMIIMIIIMITIF